MHQEPQLHRRGSSTDVAANLDVENSLVVSFFVSFSSPFWGIINFVVFVNTIFFFSFFHWFFGARIMPRCCIDTFMTFTLVICFWSVIRLLLIITIPFLLHLPCILLFCCIILEILLREHFFFLSRGSIRNNLYPQSHKVGARSARILSYSNFTRGITLSYLVGR